MDKKQLIKKLKDIQKAMKDLIEKLEKTKAKDKQIKINLQLLWYNTKCINMLWLWKDLQIINREKANKEIAKRILENKEIYNKLLLLKQ